MEDERQETSKHSAEFLLTVYNQLNEETRRLRSEGLSRLNFFITISSTALAGLVVLSQSNSASLLTVLLVSIGAVTFLILLGWPTFRFTVSRDISTDLNLRAMGRITRYFIDSDNRLAIYLTWQLHDEPTKWVDRNASGVRNTSQVILSTLIALNMGLITYTASMNLLFCIAAGAVLFCVAFISLDLYARRRFNSAKKRAQKEVRFPRLTVQSITDLNSDISATPSSAEKPKSPMEVK